MRISDWSSDVCSSDLVTDGFIRKALKARITRDDVIVYNGEIASLRRFKDDVAEVRAGLECGVTFAGHTDIKPGDYLETYEVEERARTLCSIPSPPPGERVR